MPSHHSTQHEDISQTQCHAETKETRWEGNQMRENLTRLLAKRHSAIMKQHTLQSWLGHINLRDLFLVPIAPFCSWVGLTPRFS